MNTTNTILPLLIPEFESETALARKMLRIVPDNQWDYKPHEKSMSMRALTTHIAELASWPAIVLHSDGIDFATMDYTPAPVASNADLMDLFEKSVGEGRAALEAATDADLQPAWTMRSGETVLNVASRYETLRGAFAQIIHHRAQLGVYLRLLDIPIPGTYGPSADDQSF